MTSKTIISLWKKEFSKNKSNPFMWDNILGMQTKKDFIIKAYLISDYIKKIEGDYIGIMLPSVGSAPLIIIATYLAGKVPVMFNWTLGKEAFDHCVKFSKVRKILTSSNFYDRVKNDFLEEYNSSYKNQSRDTINRVSTEIPPGEEEEKNVENKDLNSLENNPPSPFCEGGSITNFVFLEDLLKNVSLVDKVKALIKGIFMPLPSNTSSQPSPLKEKEQNIAVILFTSGSESLPKAVALTHKNLIENIKGAISIFELREYDKLLGFLPPFHSFGFTVNTIMPLITGLQVAYTPDPNDAKTILEIIKHTKITSITSTPTFLKMIMALAKVGDLESIKYVVVGAEKCGKDVFEKFEELCPEGKILEGYGITECSPVISINPINNPKPGSVGKVIPNLDCKIIDIEKYSSVIPAKVGINENEKDNLIEGGQEVLKEVKTGEQGMIYVAGSSIFDGYLDKKLASPFDNIFGKKYYKTGDLGYLDEEGYLYITGRLKRFIKIAGEMISLPFVEGILSEKYSSDKDVKIAIEALEKDGQAKIVLFTIDDICLDEVNNYLRNRGVSNLVKISEIQKIDSIPVLGTGKTDYKELKKLIK